MRPYKEVTDGLAEKLIRKITRKVKKHFQTFREGHLQDRDDSCLANAWDEICV